MTVSNLRGMVLQANGLQLPEEVTNETPAQARIDLYQSRSCLFVTTRILVSYLALIRTFQAAGASERTSWALM